MLANRLSADPQTRVLLLKRAAGDANPLMQAPGKWTSLLGHRDRLELRDRAGAGLGGAQHQVAARQGATADRARSTRWPTCAAISSASTRGRPRSGPSWSYAALLPYFRRAEDNSRGASDYHGAGGPLAVSRHDRSARRTPRVSRSGARARIRGAAGLGFQRRAAGARRRLLSEEHPRRSPPFGGGRVSRARARASESHRLARTRRRCGSTLDGRRVTGVEVLRAGARDARARRRARSCWRPARSNRRSC